MIDAEKLLGKVLGELTGTGSRAGKRKKKHASGLNSMVTGQLTSGKGLMTLIGLGVGAYEIYRQQQTSQPGGISGQGIPPGAPPQPTGTSAGSPPPPPPPPPVDPPPSASSATAQETQDLSLKMIQVMVAAAHADGTLDEAEEQRILKELQGAQLSREETLFLLEELHHPKSIEQLVQGVTDPAVAKTMYMLSVTAIDIDTEAERLWLDQLAQALQLSKGMQSFLEQQ